MPDVNWGSVADWVSGIGSFSAALVALYVARSSQRVRLLGFCGSRLIVSRARDPIDVFAVSATNASQRPTIVTNISLTFGVWRWKRHGIMTFLQDDISHGIPKPLSDGETGSWNARMNDQWLKKLVENFELDNFSVETMKVLIHTSNGGVTVLRPEKGFRDKIKSFIKEMKNV